MKPKGINFDSRLFDLERYGGKRKKPASFVEKPA